MQAQHTIILVGLAVCFLLLTAFIRRAIKRAIRRSYLTGKIAGIRDEEHVLCDGQVLKVEPNAVWDFRSLPFKLVMFDPPNLTRAGVDSWMRAKYGLLTKDRHEDISKGFTEYFRLLASASVFIFKRVEIQVRVSELLALTDLKSLFGHKSGKREKAHWIIFIKQGGKTL